RWQAARAAGNLGGLLLDQKRREEAGQQLGRARELLRKLAAEFPSVAQYSQELASVEYNLGLMAAHSGRPDEAVIFYKESARLLELLRSRFPETPALRLKL